MNKITATIVGAAVGLILPMQLAFADGGAALGPLSELTGEWWQWALSIPSVKILRLMRPGNIAWSANVDLFGFWPESLAGGGIVTRACSVPEDKALFFPVINSFWNNTPSTNPDCGQSGENWDVKTLISNIKTTGIELRSRSIGDCRRKGTRPKANTTCSIPPVSYRVPGRQRFWTQRMRNGRAATGGGIFTIDGRWILCPAHAVEGRAADTLKFHGEYGSGPVLEDVTYNLTVVPVSLK